MGSSRVVLRLIPKSEEESLTLGQFAALVGSTERSLKAAGRILHPGCHLRTRIRKLGMGSLCVDFTAEVARGSAPEQAPQEAVSLFLEAITPEENVRPQVQALRRMDAFQRLTGLWVRSLDSVEINGRVIPAKRLRELAALTSKGQSRAMVYLSVTGRLEAVNIHGRPQFRVYSPLGEATKCIFPDEMLDQVKQLLGRRVVVRGIRRRGGGPLHVQRLELREAKGPSLLELKGAWKGLLEEPSEVVIRRMRDEDED